MRTWKKVSGAASAALLIALLSAAPASAETIDTEPQDTTSAEARFAENRDLSPEQVYERTLDLNRTYADVGDVLSEVDAEFVQIYAPAGAQSTDEVAPMAETYTPFDASREAQGERGTISGNMSLYTEEFSINNNYKGEISAAGSAGVTSIQTCFSVRAYGTVGEAGVAVVFADDPCNTTQGRSAQFSVDKNYSGFVISATMTADATFYLANGNSFQVSSTL